MVMTILSISFFIYVLTAIFPNIFGRYTETISAISLVIAFISGGYYYYKNWNNDDFMAGIGRMSIYDGVYSVVRR
jgi:hypothetical protein